jgi:hypothetical protein
MAGNYQHCSKWLRWIKIMNVLIHDINSARYLAPNNRWTDNVMEAEDFGFTLTADSTAKMMNLKHYEIIYFCPETHYRILIFRSTEDQPAGRQN